MMINIMMPKHLKLPKSLLPNFILLPKRLLMPLGLLPKLVMPKPWDAAKSVMPKLWDAESYCHQTETATMRDLAAVPKSFRTANL